MVPIYSHDIESTAFLLLRRERLAGRTVASFKYKFREKQIAAWVFIKSFDIFSALKGKSATRKWQNSRRFENVQNQWWSAFYMSISTVWWYEYRNTWKLSKVDVKRLQIHVLFFLINKYKSNSFVCMLNSGLFIDYSQADSVWLLRLIDLIKVLRFILCRRKKVASSF